MSNPTDPDPLGSMASGDPRGFETLFERYNLKLRLAAWRVCRRADWLDDLVNETWRRAYEGRQAYDPARPFLVWLTGILRNVFREHCRAWTGGGPAGAAAAPPSLDDLDPARIAAEAELLVALDACVARLPAADAELVRRRFFDGQSLRAIALAVGIPESTLREARLPAIFADLRTCLERKGVDLSQFFSAQGGDVLQYLIGERG